MDFGTKFIWSLVTGDFIAVDEHGSERFVSRLKYESVGVLCRGETGMQRTIPARHDRYEPGS